MARSKVAGRDMPPRKIREIFFRKNKKAINPPNTNDEGNKLNVSKRENP